jgi:hypothetical protein
MRDAITVSARYPNPMAFSPTTSIVTAENVVIPPQNPGSKNQRSGVIPRRSINTRKYPASATPMRLALSVPDALSGVTSERP